MGLMASDTGGTDFEITEAGVHPAVCYAVIDLGTQHNDKWDQWQHKCVIIWELPKLRIQIEDNGTTTDKPRVISRKFTISLGSKSHMRPFLESWRGKPFSGTELVGFNLQSLVGVNCQLNVIHNVYNEKTYANVAAAMPLGKDMPKLQPENETIYYSIEDHGLVVPETVPKWIKDIILECREMNEIGQMNDWPDDNPADSREGPPIEDDDIPF